MRSLSRPAPFIEMKTWFYNLGDSFLYWNKFVDLGKLHTGCQDQWSPRQWPHLSFQGSHVCEGQCAWSCLLDSITSTCWFTGQEQVGWSRSRRIRSCSGNLRHRHDPVCTSSEQRQLGEKSGGQHGLAKGELLPSPADGAILWRPPRHVSFKSFKPPLDLKTSHPVTELPAVVIAIIIKATYTSACPRDTDSSWKDWAESGLAIRSAPTLEPLFPFLLLLSMQGHLLSSLGNFMKGRCAGIVSPENVWVTSSPIVCLFT